MTRIPKAFRLPSDSLAITLFITSQGAPSLGQSSETTDALDVLISYARLCDRNVIMWSHRS